MKKIISLVLTVLVLTLGTGGMAFAETSSVPAHLNVAASSVSFTITEKIQMTAEAGNPNLTIDNLVVTNTGAMGQIQLDSLEITAEDGWSLVDSDTDFINMAVDQNQISIVSGTHDFAENGTMQIGKTAGPKGTVTVEFQGKTGASSAAVTDRKVATVVATVSLT